MHTDNTTPDDPIGDFVAPTNYRIGARNHALAGRAPRVNDSTFTTILVTVGFPIGHSNA